MTDTLTLTVNGKTEEIRGVPPERTLLEYLRDTSRVGTKEGCAEGDCGACTVAVLGAGPDGQAAYQAMNSCLIPLSVLAGREIVTVEGVAQGAALHPVQEAMVDLGGSQCGYCTPGFVMSLFAAYYDGRRDDGVVEGNLCRCTGYLPIRRALRSLAAPATDDPFAARLAQETTEPRSVAYEADGQHFFRPSSLSEVFEILETHPEARLVAGGTDLGLELTQKHRHFPVLVSLEAVTPLQLLSDTADALTVGAAVPLARLEARAAGLFPALDDMLGLFAARQVRNRATLGGNLGTASPIGDLPPVLLALDAELSLACAGGERVVRIADFFTGYRQSVLRPGELIAWVRLPKALPAGARQRLSRSYKAAKRGTDDISTVAAAFTIDLDGSDRVLRARLAYGGVAATPVRATAVEESLTGRPWNEAAVQQAATALRGTFSPLDDLRGSAAYRRQLAGNLFEKFFFETSIREAAA